MLNHTNYKNQDLPLCGILDFPIYLIQNDKSGQEPNSKNQEPRTELCNGVSGCRSNGVTEITDETSFSH